MKYSVDAIRSSSGPRRNALAALSASLGAIIALPNPASAQTAFTLPAPPFDLPILPPVSGNRTVMVGVGGEYRPSFEGSKNLMLSPIPIFTIRLRHERRTRREFAQGRRRSDRAQVADNPERHAPPLIGSNPLERNTCLVSAYGSCL
jgi:hypothetical protein